MANCKNCNRQLSCQCLEKRASDGQRCCVVCIEEYENLLKANTYPSQDYDKIIDNFYKKLYHGREKKGTTKR